MISDTMQASKSKKKVLSNNYNRELPINDAVVLFLSICILCQEYFAFFTKMFFNSESLVFAVRDIFILLMFIISISKRRLKLFTFEKFYVAYFIISIIILIENLSLSSVYSMRLYILPFCLYFIGRFFTSRKFPIALYINVLAIIFVFFSIFPIVISYNKNVFSILDIPLGGNYYYYSLSYGLIERFIGPFLDPLATAFFLVPFISYYRYNNSRNIVKTLLFAFLFFLLLLTITRAIILSFMAVFLLIKKNRISSWSYITIIIIISITILFVACNYQKIISLVDPSTYGHLFAYYSNLQALIDRPMGYGYFRHSENIPLAFESVESLYFSILLEQGPMSLLVFLMFIFGCLRYIKSSGCNNLFFIYISGIVFLLASFTTEHFFATSSSYVFWIGLGSSISKINLIDDHEHDVLDVSQSNCIPGGMVNV